MTMRKILSFRVMPTFLLAFLMANMKWRLRELIRNTCSAQESAYFYGSELSALGGGLGRSSI